MKYKITKFYKEPYIEEFETEEDFEEWLDKNFEIVESFEKLN